MTAPLDMPVHAEDVWQRFMNAQSSPLSMLQAAATLGAIPLVDAVDATAGSATSKHQVSLDEALALVSRGAVVPAEAQETSDLEAPSAADLPEPLRGAVARMLLGIHAAEKARQRAFAQLPGALTPSALINQFPAAIDARGPVAPATDLRRMLDRVDRRALLQGMTILVDATIELSAFLSNTPALPAVLWRKETSLGTILVDTSGANSVHRIDSPLLVIDVGGDDTYVFDSRGDDNRIAVLLDRGGNDSYHAMAPGTDPSAGILGYGVLWDSEGDDDYRGVSLSQGAALFGAALHIDQRGRDRYTATAYSQGFAVAGWSVLSSSPEDTSFDAISHSQASAGPEGVAVLFDAGGDDRYTLSNTPLLFPSPQLESRNTSMGQGAGRGLRPDTSSDGISTTGGVGLLLDVAGDDRYTAQVFAQGVGYHEGVGILMDGGGNDRWQAAWYAMGAAAHNAAGALIKRACGHDAYDISHSVGLGAAHDFSAAVFWDQGGNDNYRVGDVGFGVSLDNSVALFVDREGEDHYAMDAAACRGFGFAALDDRDPERAAMQGVGLFIEQQGDDTYPALCQARNGKIWTTGSWQDAGPPPLQWGMGRDDASSSRTVFYPRHETPTPGLPPSRLVTTCQVSASVPIDAAR